MKINQNIPHYKYIEKIKNKLLNYQNEFQLGIKCVMLYVEKGQIHKTHNKHITQF